MKWNEILIICLDFLHLKQMQYREFKIFPILPTYNSMRNNFNIGTVNTTQKKFV